MTALDRSCLAVGLAFLTACGTTSPPLPKLHTASMQPAVRKLIEQAYDEAQNEPPSAEATRKLGMVLQAHHENQAAEATYARAHALDPDNTQTLYYWGQLLAARGEHQSAIQLFRKARPASLPLRLALANSLRESGDRTASAILSRQLILEDPNNATAYYLLARALDTEADYQKAIDLYPRYGAARFSLAALYRKHGKSELAAKMLENYERDKLTTPPVEDADNAALEDLNIGPAGLLRRAVHEESVGRLAEAAALQVQALAIEPNLPDAWANIISLEARLGHDKAVEEAYTMSSSTNAAAHYNYGVYCIQRHRLDEAAKAFRETLDIAPNHAEAALNLAGIAVERRNLPQAMTLLRQATAARPNFAQAHFQLGRLLARKGQNQAAIEEFERAAKSPESAETEVGYLYAWGVALARSGTREPAIIILERAESQAIATNQTALAASIRRDLAILHKLKKTP